VEDPYLVDTSAWVELLRGTGSGTHRELRRLLREHPDQVGFTEPVIMELLAGARTDAEVARMEELFDGHPLLPVDPWVDYRGAAAAARACRSIGRPARSIVDCLIAAVAVRTGAAVLHRDRDFDHLAACLPDLRLHPT
jgi:predicted nucleic acid-binding protein